MERMPPSTPPLENANAMPSTLTSAELVDNAQETLPITLKLECADAQPDTHSMLLVIACQDVEPTKSSTTDSAVVFRDITQSMEDAEYAIGIKSMIKA